MDMVKEPCMEVTFLNKTFTKFRTGLFVLCLDFKLIRFLETVILGKINMKIYQKMQPIFIIVL